MSKDSDELARIMRRAMRRPCLAERKQALIENIDRLVDMVDAEENAPGRLVRLVNEIREQVRRMCQVDSDGGCGR